MNDYDKAGRSLIKRDPVGFFRWLLAVSRLSFQGWIDARRVALANQSDLTNDLVAALRSGTVQEAIYLELEAEARADALPRLLKYLARLWTEPGGPASLPITCVSGAIADLGSLAKEFAGLARCRPAWEHGLRRWNMKTSPFLDEIRAEGRAEGRVEGRAEGVRAAIFRMGRKNFGKAPTKKQQKTLEAIADLAQLEALAERLLDVQSWAELLDNV